MRINFNQLITGKTDAKNEVLLNNPDSINKFKEIFVLPQGFSSADFFRGDRYVICGLKGTGKTALLRYLALSLPEKFNANFIYFKSDLKEDDREEIEKLSTFIVGDGSEFKRSDYEKAWRWFFLRRIIELNTTFGLFREDESFNKAKALIMSVNCEKTRGGLSYLFPRIIDGKVSVNVAEIAKFDVNFKFSDKIEDGIRFSELVDKAYDIFINLTTNKSLFLFIDEIELSYLSDETYIRDSELIRDLLISIKELNQVFKEMEIDINLVAAVRSEVLTAVGAIGKEISKIVEDFGFPITWHRYERGKIEHPLIQMMINRFRQTERIVYGSCNDNNKTIFQKYFSETVFHKSFINVILNNTWFRPRDIVRWLNVIRTIHPDKDFINQQVYETTRREYSTYCLNEVFEELNAIYDKDHLSAIQELLTEMKINFSFQDFCEKVKYLSKNNTVINAIKENNLEKKLLFHLYSCGMIGNFYQVVIRQEYTDTYRWIYRGDSQLLIDKGMTVHPALRPVLSIREY
jgi:energy-coupling factor transporter ATP-binding protein EcfA2